jgi:hypothetical protein
MLRSATSFLLRTASRPSASMLLSRTKTTTGQFGVLSGAPKDELERKVFIFRPAKSAGQHASAAVPSNPWKLSFEKKDRWINPLMGWTSSSDSLAGQTPGNINFESKDAAIAFAEKNGSGIRFVFSFLHIRLSASVFHLIIFQAGKSFWRSQMKAKYVHSFTTASSSSPLIRLSTRHWLPSDPQSSREELRRELPVGGRRGHGGHNQAEDNSQVSGSFRFLFLFSFLGPAK